MGIMNKTIRVAKIKVKKPSTYRLVNTGQEKSHSIGNQAALDGLHLPQTSSRTDFDLNHELS